MSVKLKRYVTNTNSYRENGSLSDDIFTRNILRHNCFMFKYSVKKAVSEITARQTRTGLYIHDVIRVCSIEYLTTQIALVLCQFSYNSRTVYKIMDYLTLRLLSSLWNIYHSHRRRLHRGNRELRPGTHARTAANVAFCPGTFHGCALIF